MSTSTILSCTQISRSVHTIFCDRVKVGRITDRGDCRWTGTITIEGTKYWTPVALGSRRAVLRHLALAAGLAVLAGGDNV